MKNLINFIDIPATDFGRAVSFYKAVLEISINEADVFGTKMGFFPSDGKNASGAIVQGEGYKPSTEGVLVYLNGGDDLQNPLSRVEPNGGKVLVPKTFVNPEVGHIAIFLDSEGNKMAFHSMG